MSLDRIKKLISYLTNEDDGGFSGTVGDLGELPKLAYGSVDSRGGSVVYKDKSLIKKKKKRRHKPE